MPTPSKITIVGGIPKPIGGVTAYVQRLVVAYTALVRCVVDLYPAEEKMAIPVPHRQLRTPVMVLLWWLVWRTGTPIYFNFSGARGLLILALLRKPRNGKWALTLHNGDVASHLVRYGRLQGCANVLMRHGLGKCDLVGVISAKQEAFYLSMGFAPANLAKISPYFPPPQKLSASGSAAVPQMIKTWRSEGHDVFLISGYPMNIYRHLEVLERFEEMWNGGRRSMRLALFLYGNDPEGLLAGLQERFEAAPFAVHYWDTGNEAFLAALALSTGYLRMNSVDSFGVAVAEAITLGVPVLATNVCARFPGATLVDPDDFDAMERFVSNVPSPPERLDYDNGVGTFLRRVADIP